MKHEYRFSDFMAIILCCFLFIGNTAAANAEEEAAARYENKQYKEALDIWYRLVQSGNTGAGIYYNIGVAESMLQNTSKAVLAFEKAVRFKPSDQKITEALTRERKKIEGGTTALPVFFLTRWLQGLSSLLRPGYWAMLGLAVFLIYILRVIRFKDTRLITRVRERNIVFGMLTAGVVFIALAGYAYQRIYRADEAIVVTPCEFRRAPSEDSPQIRSLFPGEKVIVSDQIGDWYHVNLLNLDDGWVKSDFLEFIIIDGVKPAGG